MSKKVRIALISIGGILLFSIVTAVIVLMSITSEFAGYLDTKYPELSFKVGFAKIDPIYGNYYSKVTCLNDATIFPISRSFTTKKINEDYLQHKSQNLYNSKLKEIFNESGIESYLKSVTGGGKKPFEINGAYTQINVTLTDNADYILVAQKVLHILKENKVSVERLILTYEKEKHVYEIWLSSEDYCYC